MNKVKLILLSLLLCGISFNAEAQFLKQLKKQVVDRTKEAIIDKTANKVADDISDKVSDQVAGAINSAVAAGYEGMIPALGSIKDIETLPAEYNFDYLYSVKMNITEGGEMLVDYYLNKSEPYLGIKINLSDDIMLIFDEQNKALITKMGDKTFATNINYDDDSDTSDKELQDYTITKLPNKSFLGRDCIGRLIENDLHRMKVYIDTSTGVSLDQVFKNKHAKVPSNMKEIFNSSETGIVMYAEMTDKSNNNMNMTLECTEFRQQSMVINTR